MLVMMNEVNVGGSLAYILKNKYRMTLGNGTKKKKKKKRAHHITATQ